MGEKASQSSHAYHREGRFIIILSKFLLILAVLTAAQDVPSAAAVSKDGEILLAFADGVSNPSVGPLASWNRSDTTPCKWTGVHCNSSTSQVVSLELASANLQGRLEGADLCGLQALRLLNLSSNYLESTMPTDLGDCQQLEILDLSNNSLSGTFAIQQ